MTYQFPKPVVDIRDNVNELHATGDDKTHLVVTRGPLSQDSDASWQQVQQHVREHGFVLAQEFTLPGTNMGDLRRLIYVTPDKRIFLNDHTAGSPACDGEPRNLAVLRALSEASVIREQK